MNECPSVAKSSSTGDVHQLITCYLCADGVGEERRCVTRPGFEDHSRWRWHGGQDVHAHHLHHAAVPHGIRAYNVSVHVTN